MVSLATIAICVGSVSFGAGYDTVRGAFLVQEGLPERPDWGHAFGCHMTP